MHAKATETSDERTLPEAIAVCGPAGAGKTTLASALASALGYAIADLDAVAGRLTALALELGGADPADLESPLARRLRDARYGTLLEVARANIVAGLGVVLAAPFSAERRSPQAWASVVERLSAGAPGASVSMIYLEVPADIVHGRLVARAAPRDRRSLLRGPQAVVGEKLIPEAIVLDGAAPVSAQLASALSAIAVPAGARLIGT